MGMMVALLKQMHLQNDTGSYALCTNVSKLWEEGREWHDGWGDEEKEDKDGDRPLRWSWHHPPWLWRGSSHDISRTTVRPDRFAICVRSDEVMRFQADLT